MSDIIEKFNTFNKVIDTLKKAKNNNEEIVKFADTLYKTAGVNGQTIQATIDYAGGNSENWRQRFNASFNKEYFGKPNPKFELLKALNQDQKEAVNQQVKFSTTVGGEAGTTDYGSLVQTNIVAAIDGLYQRDSILGRVQVIQDQQSYQLPEFGEEETADRIAENAQGDEKDDIPRDGDTLTVTNQTNKIKVFEKVSDLLLRTMRPEDYGILQARLARKMQRKFETEILTGTNATGQFAGFINATTGATAFGALQSTLPLSAVANGVQDDVDAIKYLISDLPSETQDNQDLSRYTLITNRATKWRLKRTRDANGRTYDLNSEFEGLEMFQSFAMTNNRALLADLSLYSVLLAKPIDIEVEKETNTEMLFIKSFTYADGGMRMGYKTQADGTTANVNKNAHRYADLKADYSV